jgi:hypothetical protein
MSQLKNRRRTGPRLLQTYLVRSQREDPDESRFTEWPRREYKELIDEEVRAGRPVRTELVMTPEGITTRTCTLLPMPVGPTIRTPRVPRSRRAPPQIGDVTTPPWQEERE